MAEEGFGITVVFPEEHKSDDKRKGLWIRPDENYQGKSALYVSDATELFNAELQNLFALYTNIVKLSHSLVKGVYALEKIGKKERVDEIYNIVYDIMSLFCRELGLMLKRVGNNRLRISKKVKEKKFLKITNKRLVEKVDLMRQDVCWDQLKDICQEVSGIKKTLEEQNLYNLKEWAECVDYLEYDDFYDLGDDDDDNDDDQE